MTGKKNTRATKATAKKKTPMKRSTSADEGFDIPGRPEDASTQPMDASAVEKAVGIPAAASDRSAYALAALIDEIQSLYPEVAVEITKRTGRGVGVEAQFAFDSGSEYLTELLSLLVLDERIEEVVIDREEGLSTVSVWPNPRTQDSRESFGLVEAYAVMIDSADPELSATAGEDSGEEDFDEAATNLGGSL